MKLWLARAEGLAAHLLWRLSHGRVAGHWLQRGEISTTTGLPEEEGDMIGISMSDISPSFASRIAELQREAEPPPPAENGHAHEQRELSTGMFILIALLVLALAVGSFFL